MLKEIKKAFTNLFKPPLTHPYPQKPIEKKDNFRGLIEYNEKECIFCLKCEKVCPPQAIIFTALNQEQKRVKNQKLYHYNPYLCIYCGECVRECPKPDLALWQSSKKPPVATAQDLNESWEKVKAKR